MEAFYPIEQSSQRIFAIGDIHGCHAELTVLLTYLKGKLSLGANDTVVFIGDYIDRGPNSKGVIEELLQFKVDYPRSVFLRGNHEDMLLGFLGLGTARAPYLANGGDSFFRSYGIDSLFSQEEAVTLLPQEHLDFLLATVRYAISEDYIFAHAGLDPLRPAEHQVDSDLYWIREPFIDNIHRFGKAVVFGHTPFKDVFYQLPYKIGLDTGLVYGNKLTCIELSHREVFQVANRHTKVKRSQFPASGEKAARRF